MFEILEQLMITIRERISSLPDNSYTSPLLKDYGVSISKNPSVMGETVKKALEK